MNSERYMSEPAFRRDIQDELLRLLFDKYRINFLKIPIEDLVPGQAYLVRPSIDATPPVAFGPMALDGLIPEIVVPGPSKPARLADVNATFSADSRERAEARVFSSLFARFMPGTPLPDVEAKLERQGIKELRLGFSNATRTSLDFAALGRAIRGKILDLSAFENDEGLRIFVATDVFSCTGLEMTWNRGGEHDVNADLVVAELAKLGAGHKAKKVTDGSVSVGGDVPLAFGIRVLELVRRDDGKGFRLRLDHTRIDVLGGDSEAESADSRDYPMLASPWSGELDIDVRPRS